MPEKFDFFMLLAHPHSGWLSFYEYAKTRLCTRAGFWFLRGLGFMRQPRFCGAIDCYSAGGVHRSLLPPEPPEELLPPLSGAGVVTRGVWRRVVEAA